MTGQFIGYDVTSDDHLKTIKRWLSDRKRHLRSQMTVGRWITDTSNCYLPTRCLHITKGGFVLKNTAEVRDSYVTLSHRWNEETELSKTTTSNLPARLDGREFSSLPKVFEDAIAIVKALGYEYLWIDSLCINQDKKSGDWALEAVKMAEYYQQSVFTISAKLSSVAQGLIQPPQLQGQLDPRCLARLPYYDRDGRSAGHFYVYRRHRPLVDEFIDCVHNSALSKRGWVFQEWMLSRNVISFTDAGLFLECLERSPTNDRGETLQTMALRKNGLQLKHWLYDDLLTGALAGSEHSGLHLVEFWYNAVESYSAKDLTKPEEDRVLAISGVAKMLREMLQKYGQPPAHMADSRVPVLEYISGHWFCDIHYSLLWEQKNGPHKYKPGCAAPSWSWARLMVPVKWAKRYKSMKAMCTVVGLKTKDATVYSVVRGLVSKRLRGNDDAERNVDGNRREGGGEDGRDQAMTFNREIEDESPNKLSGSSSPPPTAFDITNMYTTLIVQVRLVPVLIRDYLSSHPNPVASPESELDIAANMTGHHPAFGRSAWRAVCSTHSPDLIAGWASLEEEPGTSPESPGSASVEDIAVQALLVATHKSDWVGFQLGMMLKTHDICHVLYVEQVAGERYGSVSDEQRRPCCPKYRRLGVGRIFELGLTGEFRNAEVQEIELT